MIRDLSVNFEYEGLQHFIKVPSEDDNLPYNLAGIQGNNREIKC